MFFFVNNENLKIKKKKKNLDDRFLSNVEKGKN